MPCVIFDFDSTLIREESLESILAPLLAENPGRMSQIRDITDMGMDGTLNFAESLSRRLEIASPTFSSVSEYGQTAKRHITTGMPDLVTDLRSRGVMIRIVSGGLREAILPVAEHLGIPAEHVHAVRLHWHKDGTFAGLNPDDEFSTGKVAGLRRLAPTWPGPRIGIGDGMTDAQPWQVGLIDHFVAFTANVRRHAVLATGAPEADSVSALRGILEEWL